MDENTKRRFDVLSTLEERAWYSFNKRRTYEWKSCFAVWTVFAVFTGNMLTREIASANVWIWVGVIIIGLCITLLHARWIYHVAAANRHDKRMANRYKLLMQNILSPTLSGTRSWQS